MFIVTVGAQGILLQRLSQLRLLKRNDLLTFLQIVRVQGIILLGLRSFCNLFLPNISRSCEE